MERRVGFRGGEFVFVGGDGWVLGGMDAERERWRSSRDDDLKRGL